MKKATKKLSLNKTTISRLNKGTLVRVLGGGSGCECDGNPNPYGSEVGCNPGTSAGTGGGGTYNTCASCVGLSCNIDCPETVTGDPQKDCWFCEY